MKVNILLVTVVTLTPPDTVHMTPPTYLFSSSDVCVNGDSVDMGPGIPSVQPFPPPHPCPTHPTPPPPATPLLSDQLCVPLTVVNDIIVQTFSDSDSIPPHDGVVAGNPIDG